MVIGTQFTRPLARNATLATEANASGIAPSSTVCGADASATTANPSTARSPAMATPEHTMAMRLAATELLTGMLLTAL